jgi:hypothetical protein
VWLQCKVPSEVEEEAKRPGGTLSLKSLWLQSPSGWGEGGWHEAHVFFPSLFSSGSEGRLTSSVTC